MKKLLKIFRKDKRTPEEKIRDGIRKQVSDYSDNKFKLMLSHSIRPNGFRIDHKPELQRKFH